MKLKFKKQDYQTEAVNAVADCFGGQPTSEGVKFRIDPGAGDKLTLLQKLAESGFANEDFRITPHRILQNIQEVQRRQSLPISPNLVIDTQTKCTFNLDIEMETGTGKTYCYIKTMFEMNKLYGWSKFIVVVPSVAIREGVHKSFEIMKDHFLEHYGKQARFFIYNSKQLHNIESFSSDAGINVMIINVQAFNATGKDNRRIYEELDDFQSRRPIDVIKANRPILILDEPQKMGGDLAGKLFSDLSSDLRRFVDRELVFNADIVKSIDDPKNPEHQKVATEIFWRLQQGEMLNFMEIAHAKLSSLSRNFIVKYSDDESFDYVNYVPVDENPHKHKFFQILGRKNNRMQHLTTMTRFLLIEEAGGYADLKDSAVVEFIEKYEEDGGIGNYSLENQEFAKACLKNLNEYFSIFETDSMWDENTGIKELGREYLTISLYFLIRHLRLNYIITDIEKDLIRRFFYQFHERWNKGDQDDFDIERFSNRRQQSKNDLQERDIIFRQLFFDFLTEEKAELLTYDKKRAFNEAEKIKIYRRDNGLCQHCVKEGKPESEAQVSWTDYQADHILAHALGGETVEDNAQVLCKYHNARKGAKQEPYLA